MNNILQKIVPADKHKMDKMETLELLIEYEDLFLKTKNKMLVDVDKK